MPLLLGQGMDVQAVPHCCSEAGTLAISRPDISHAMLSRKQKAVKEAVQGQGSGPGIRSGTGAGSFPGAGQGRKRKILTNCPSCVQGLGRQADLLPVHLAEELALLTGGKDWVQKFKNLVSSWEKVSF